MAGKLSGLPKVVITSPKVTTIKPAGLVPTVTPLHGPTGAVTTPAILPSAELVSDMVQTSNEQATE